MWDDKSVVVIFDTLLPCRLAVIVRDTVITPAVDYFWFSTHTARLWTRATNSSSRHMRYCKVMLDGYALPSLTSVTEPSEYGNNGRERIGHLPCHGNSSSVSRSSRRRFPPRLPGQWGVCLCGGSPSQQGARRPQQSALEQCLLWCDTVLRRTGVPVP